MYPHHLGVNSSFWVHRTITSFSRYLSRYTHLVSCLVHCIYYMFSKSSAFLKPNNACVDLWNFWVWLFSAQVQYSVYKLCSLIRKDQQGNTKQSYLIIHGSVQTVYHFSVYRVLGSLGGEDVSSTLGAKQQQMRHHCPLRAPDFFSC